ncbi:MAG: sulfotransferase domain-containing protein, partial [Planctomycetota bacterium]
MKAFFVGPEKTGSSWIHRLLKHRGDVVLPKTVKELFFFDRYFENGINWYQNQFSGDISEAVDVAPSYFKETAVPTRIKQHFPDSEIIVTLRSPVERTLSMYQHLIANGWTTLPFSKALKIDPH